MNLTDLQRIKLRKDIETVLTEDKLKSILLEHEEKFGRNFYNQISGNDYQTRLVYLIRELNNRQLIDFFISFVGQEYPTVNSHYQCYKQLSTLFFIFQEIITINNDFIKDCFNFESIDSLEKYLLSSIPDLNNNDPLLNSTSSPDNLNLLNSSENLTDFVEKDLAKILNVKYLTDNQKKRLKLWIKRNYPDIVLPSENTHQSILQSYLLILIYKLPKVKTKRYKNPINPRFTIHAEFIENFPHTRNIPVELNQEDIKEQGYLEKELEKEIPNIIYNFIEKVENETQYLRSKVLNNQPYTLRIELFLPIEFFTKDFEFKSPDIWEPDQGVICEKYSVILRSIDRFFGKKTNWLNSCLKKWLRIKTTTVKEILDFNREDELNALLSEADQIRQLRNKLYNTIILKISCALPKDKSKIDHLFTIILEEGIPLCLWIQSQKNLDYSSISDELNNLIKSEYFEDINKLYTQIFKMRKNQLADPNRKDCHLRVLCDNIDRKPFKLPNSNPLTN